MYQQSRYFGAKIRRIGVHLHTQSYYIKVVLKGVFNYMDMFSCCDNLNQGLVLISPYLLIGYKKKTL